MWMFNHACHYAQRNVWDSRFRSRVTEKDWGEVLNVRWTKNIWEAQKKARKSEVTDFTDQ